MFEDFLFLQGIPGTILQQDNACRHVARNVQDFFSAENIQLLPWSACSSDMSSIQNVWGFIDRCLSHDPHFIASTDELWIHVQTIRNAFPQEDI